MARLLFHITTGPENPTKATLGLLIARTAAERRQEMPPAASASATRVSTTRRWSTTERRCGAQACQPRYAAWSPMGPPSSLHPSSSSR